MKKKTWRNRQKEKVFLFKKCEAFTIILNMEDKIEFTITLKNDYAFKRILGVEENKPLLQDFLECVLDLEHDEIEGLELLDKELKKDHAEDRTGILDIQVRLRNGMLIDVEMQAVWEDFFIDRSFSYLNKMYTSELKAGEPFSKAHKCVAINIIGKGFKLNDELCSKSAFVDTATGNIITDKITMYFLNLEKARGLPISKGKTKEERLINWAKFIDTESKEERKMLALSSPILELLNEKVIEITRSPEEQRLFDSRMKMRSDILTGFDVYFNRGMEKGREEGIEEGLRAKAIETAKKCLKMNMSVETIIELTGLKGEEIERLK